MEREREVKIGYGDGHRETRRATQAPSPTRAPLHPVLKLQQNFGNQAVKSLLRRARRVNRIMPHKVSQVGQQGGGALRVQKLENKAETSQELGMWVVTYSDGRIEATINQAWTEESGIGSTVIGMATVTGVSEEALIDELVASGAYRDEEQVRSGFIVGTRVVVKDSAVEEISVRGKVYKSGGKHQPDFEDFLDEGVEIFKEAEFGLCGGEGAGRDPHDGYDSRY